MTSNQVFSGPRVSHGGQGHVEDADREPQAAGWSREGATQQIDRSVSLETLNECLNFEQPESRAQRNLYL